jgi:hypothetical protein
LASTEVDLGGLLRPEVSTLNIVDARRG